MATAEILSPPQSPAKTQRCEGDSQPPASSEGTDPRSEIKYYTYDSDVEDDSDGMHSMTGEEFEEYDRQLTESDGFDVMHFPRSFGCGKTMPVFDMEGVAEDLKSHSELALKQYNEKENTNFKIVKVVKANMVPVAGVMYYITFDVKDADAVDGPTIEFQACVWEGVTQNTVLLCSPNLIELRALADADLVKPVKPVIEVKGAPRREAHPDAARAPQEVPGEVVGER